LHRSPSGAFAINDSGRVVTVAQRNDTSRYDTLLMLGPQPGRTWTLGAQGDVFGYGINAGGAAVGDHTINGRTQAVLWQGGFSIDLAPPRIGADTFARAINDAGVVVGYDGIRSALRWDAAGNVQVLPTLAPHASGDWAIALNQAGVIVGESGGKAVRWEGGQVVDLQVPGTGTSRGMGINSQGWVVGNNVSSAPDRAFLHVPGVGSQWVIDLPGVREAGWTAIAEANAINERGQFVGYGNQGSATTVAYRATLAQTVWEQRDSSGLWDNAGAWSYGVAPGVLQHAVIDPTRAITVFGPRGSAELKRLSVGGAATGGGGLATLALDGGTITIRDDPSEANPPFRGVHISARGVLTGDGRIVIEPGHQRALWNDGQIVAQDVRLDGSPVNRGLVVGGYSGTQRLQATFIGNLGANGSETGTAGVLRVLEGERLQIEGNLRSSGEIQVFGGSFTHSRGWLVNMSMPDAQGRQDVGRILGQNARLDLQGGLTLQGGQLIFSAGNNNTFGNVLVERSPADQRGGQIIVTGRSQATFYGPIDVAAGAELRISAGSVATFLGTVRQRTGALFSGSGTKFYEGGLTIGNSPGLGIDEGDVEFGASNVYEAEIGGLEPGVDFDKYIVHGQLTFGGTLKLLPWAGFAPQVGQRFDLFDWGSTAGQFDSIDSSAFGAATVWDFSRLYVDGSIGVTAVPEPGTWALWLAGLLGVGRVVRRRNA
jgi:hypothetical protein